MDHKEKSQQSQGFIISMIILSGRNGCPYVMVGHFLKNQL